MFREKCKEPKYEKPNGCSTHPHNFLLQLLAETGIFGAFPYLILYLYCIKNYFLFFFKKISKQKEDLYLKNFCILMLPFVINFNPILPSGNFFNNWLTAINCMSFGFILHYLNIDKKNK